MKVRVLAVAVAVVVVSVFFWNGGRAQADIQAIYAVDNVFTALNAGQVDTAATLFAADAVVENKVRNETYVGADEIRQMLEAMPKESRQFDIVRAEMVGDTVTLDVEISDRGIVWATETFVAAISDGKVQTLDVTAARLKL
jgi:ketosteroid isomerase-like protein